MNTIKQDDFVAWLITQPNSRGTLYLERVALHYARFLRTAPYKLDLTLSADERNVYSMRSPQEFKDLVRTFMSAPNYKEVNTVGHSAFSAGLVCFLKYLEHLTKNEIYIDNDKDDNIMVGSAVASTPVKIEQEFKDWFISRGKSENTAGQYATILHGTLVKTLKANTKVKTNLFEYTDLASFEPINVVLWSLPNFISVNAFKHNSFSAALKAYSEFLLTQGKEVDYTNINVETADNEDIAISQTKEDRIVQLLQTAGALSAREITNQLYNEHTHQSYVHGRLLKMESKGIVKKVPTAQSYNWALSDVRSDINMIDTNEVHSVINVLKNEYADGFRFDATIIRLLSSKIGIDFSEQLCEHLKRIMFKRSDDIYLLGEIVADSKTQNEILEVAKEWIDNYGCFEISQLYDLFVNELNSKCIDCTEHFSDYYEFISKQNVRVVEFWGTKSKIARVHKAVNDLFGDVAAKIIDITHDEYEGTITEEDLCVQFPAFSNDLIACIIKNYAEELVRIEINGITCYQTLDALGLNDEFSVVLAEVMEQFDELDLSPTHESLHAVLSIRLGVNFKTEYSIPDDKTYRRLIEMYYKGTPERKWRKGIFAKEFD